MPAAKWTREKAFAIASVCSTRGALLKSHSGAYHWLHGQGLLDEACLHMSKSKWNKEIVFKEASLFTTKADFRRSNERAYQWLFYHNLVDEACSHMESGLSANNKDSRLKGSYNKSGIYFLHDGIEIVYIGKSYNLAERLNRHINDKAKKFSKITTYIIENKADIDIVEVYLISKHKPKYNIQSNEHTYSTSIIIDNINTIINEEYTYVLEEG